MSWAKRSKFYRPFYAFQRFHEIFLSFMDLTLVSLLFQRSCGSSWKQNWSASRACRFPWRRQKIGRIMACNIFRNICQTEWGELLLALFCIVCRVAQFIQLSLSLFFYVAFFQSVADIFHSIVLQVERENGNTQEKSGCCISWAVALSSKDQNQSFPNFSFQINLYFLRACDIFPIIRFWNSEHINIVQPPQLNHFRTRWGNNMERTTKLTNMQKKTRTSEFYR